MKLLRLLIFSLTLSVSLLFGQLPVNAIGGSFPTVINGIKIPDSENKQYIQLFDKVRKPPPQVGYNDPTHRCGGSLLNNEWIMTAAHCVHKSKKQNDLWPSVKFLKLPVDELWIYHPYKKELRNVREIHVPDNLDAKGFRADIALIRVDKAFSFNDGITLPAANAPSITTGDAFVYGKGGIKVDANNNVIPQPGDPKTIPLWKASMPLRIHRYCGEQKDMICAGNKKEGGGVPDTCPGDSGGPLTIFSSNEKERIQVGINSHTTNIFQLRPRCGADPTWFTKVSYFTNWIKGIVGSVDIKGYEVAKPGGPPRITPTPPAPKPPINPPIQPPQPPKPPKPTKPPVQPPKPTKPPVQPTNPPKPPVQPPAPTGKPTPPPVQPPKPPVQPPIPSPQPPPPAPNTPPPGGVLPSEDPITTPSTDSSGLSCGPVNDKGAPPISADSPSMIWQPARGIDAGSDVSVQASQLTWTAAGQAKYAMLASECAWADALVSTSLADHGPLLLTNPNKLEESVKAELQRLGITTIYVIGGNRAVSLTVERELANMGITIKRAAGDTRLATARKLAEMANDGVPDTLTIARGYPSAGGTPSQAFADSLAAAYVAPNANSPIVLTQPHEISQDVIQALDSLKPASITLMGGHAAVQPGVEAAIAKVVGPKVPITRINGHNRAHTAATVAKAKIDAPADPAKGIIIIDGQADDAWKVGYTFAGLAAQTKSVYALAAGDELPPETVALIRHAKAKGLAIRCVASAKACAQATATP